MRRPQDEQWMAPPEPPSTAERRNKVVADDDTEPAAPLSVEGTWNDDDPCGGTGKVQVSSGGVEPCRVCEGGRRAAVRR